MACISFGNAHWHKYGAHVFVISYLYMYLRGRSSSMAHTYWELCGVFRNVCVCVGGGILSVSVVHGGWYVLVISVVCVYCILYIDFFKVFNSLCVGH